MTNIFKLADYAVNTKGSAFDVATVGNSILKGKYRYMGDGVWEYFDPDKDDWTIITGKTGVDMAIKIDVCQVFMERALFWQQESISANVLDKFDCQLRSQRLLEICIKLQKDKFVKDVIKELRAFLSVENY